MEDGVAVMIASVSGCVIVWWLHCGCWCWQLPSTKFGCHRPRLISHTIRTFPQTVRERPQPAPRWRPSQPEISTAPKQTSNKPMAEISDHITTSGHDYCCLCREYFIGRKQSLKGNKMCVFSGNNGSYAWSPDVGWHIFRLPAHISNITIYKPNIQ